MARVWPYYGCREYGQSMGAPILVVAPEAMCDLCGKKLRAYKKWQDWNRSNHYSCWKRNQVQWCMQQMALHPPPPQN